MLTGFIVTVLIILFFVFFIFYKRDMLIRLFSLRIEDPTLQFQNQLQETANAVVERLETQITHLEYLLEEADKRIDILNRQMQNIELAQSGSNEINNKNTVTKEILLSTTNNENLEKTDLVEEKNRRQLVFELAEQGYTITEIAKATAIGKGEIMLLLQLNKK